MVVDSLCACDYRYSHKQWFLSYWRALPFLPISSTIIQRVRRFEARFLRALSGWQRPVSTLAEFASNTRKARKIPSHVVIVTLPLP